MKLLRNIAVCLSLAILSACATGTPMSQSDAAGASVPDGKARIAVYRTNLFGLAIQPKVNVNGRETGRCTPNGVFFVTVEPGQQIVSATTEVQKTSYLTVAAGETAYVKCSIGFGLIAGQPRLDVVDASVGSAEIAKLKVMSKY